MIEEKIKTLFKQYLIGKAEIQLETGATISVFNRLRQLLYTDIISVYNCIKAEKPDFIAFYNLKGDLITIISLNP